MFNFGEKLPAQKLHQTTSEEDRLFFEQIREKASNNSQVIQTALANPLDKLQLGIRKLEEFMVQRTRAVSAETAALGNDLESKASHYVESRFCASFATSARKLLLQWKPASFPSGLVANRPSEGHHAPAAQTLARRIL
jgi:hypothetical protein